MAEVPCFTDSHTVLAILCSCTARAMEPRWRRASVRRAVSNAWSMAERAAYAANQGMRWRPCSHMGTTSEAVAVVTLSS